MIDFLVLVYKVVYPYTPRKEDELELVDDFVFVSTADQGQTGKHCSSFFECLLPSYCAFTYSNSCLCLLTCTDSEGWFFGTSFLSGCSGMCPGNYVEKTLCKGTV